MLYGDLVTMIRALFDGDEYTLGLSDRRPAGRASCRRGIIRKEMLGILDRTPAIRDHLTSILTKLKKEDAKWRKGRKK